MIYLLDVNSLVAPGLLEHEFHERAAAWVERLAEEETPRLATCSITELGFVRVLGQVEQYRLSIAQARELLLRLKASDLTHWTFLSDGHDISHLPKWVKHPKQTTDGHLAELARASGAQLATLDSKIHGGFLIPA